MNAFLPVPALWVDRVYFLNVDPKTEYLLALKVDPQLVIVALCALFPRLTMF